MLKLESFNMARCLFDMFISLLVRNWMNVIAIAFRSS